MQGFLRPYNGKGKHRLYRYEKTTSVTTFFILRYKFSAFQALKYEKGPHTGVTKLGSAVRCIFKS